MGKDGTVRDALLDQERLDGRRKDDLDAYIPPQCMELWELFKRLHSARPAALAGVAALQPSEIEAMTRLLGVTLSPWEVDTLLALDHKVCAVIIENRGDQ